MAESRLFKPLKIGSIQVQHRIGMAPLTRRRATDAHVPNTLMEEYYIQRSATPGTLLISEGTYITQAACGGFPNAPGIWSQEQITAWKKITDAVHAKGCFIFCQLFAMGRAADVETARKDGVEVVGPSAIPIDANASVPRAMTIDEVEQTIVDFATAAKNAIEAGFDGVECHGANGYLVDQFIQDMSNKRDDRYGGSIENRSRFVLRVLEGMAEAIGPQRVGLRLSPWSPFQGMKMENPIPQFSDIVARADQLGLAYLHLVESRIAGAQDHHGAESLDFAINLWNGLLLLAGGFDLAEAQRTVDQDYPDRDIMIVFGRKFIANPDLVYRMQRGIELTAHQRATFYTKTGKGYTDYPFSQAYLSNEALA